MNCEALIRTLCRIQAEGLASKENKGQMLRSHIGHATIFDLNLKARGSHKKC